MQQENKLNLFQRIISVMGDIDYIQKGKKTVNGQYRFVSHDQVTSAFHPLLVKHRVLVIPCVKKMTQEGNRTIVELDVIFMNPDDPSQSICSTFVGYGIDAADKGPGKAISYAYKYALLKTFCVETGDDADNDANVVYEPEPCIEFEGIIDGLGDKDRVKMQKFLKHSSQILNRHIEDVKREAVKRSEDFLKSFHGWTPKNKDTNS